MCSFWLCRSIVANPIIYRLVPSPSLFEIRQWQKRTTIYNTIYYLQYYYARYNTIYSWQLLFSSPNYATWYSCYLLTAKDKWIKSNIWWKIIEERVCFIQNAYLHFTDKQELIYLSNSHIESQDSALLWNKLAVSVSATESAAINANYPLSQIY